MSEVINLSKSNYSGVSDKIFNVRNEKGVPLGILREACIYNEGGTISVNLISKLGKEKELLDFIFESLQRFDNNGI